MTSSSFVTSQIRTEYTNQQFWERKRQNKLLFYDGSSETLRSSASIWILYDGGYFLPCNSHMTIVLVRRYSLCKHDGTGITVRARRGESSVEKYSFRTP